MKKLLFCLGISFVGILSAQTGNWCGFDGHQKSIYDQNPGMEEEVHEHMIRITSGGLTPSNDRVGPYTIPVVVHVVYDTEEGNISYDQILSMIDGLNEDFNALNPGISNVRNTTEAPFSPVVGNTDITFELAKIDPNGNCTNGVERRYSPSAANGADDGVKFYSQGGLSQWNRNKYMNVWVVESIDLGGGGGGTTLGYGEFPYSGGSSTYGLVVRHDVTGSIGTSNNNRTVTHEIGHCLGLFHTFQGGCHTNNCGNNGDYCCDTPPVSEAQWSCVSTQNTCSGVPSSDFYGFDAWDQYENHMSYSPCRVMFSFDQVDIMQSNMDGITFLQNLTSSSNATATGIDGPGALCQAEFSSGNTMICAGETISFEDMSYFNVTGRTWTFDGGTPGTSTAINPTVTFNSGGVYNVTLEVTDGTSTVSTTETGYVVVLDNPGAPLPYSEGFETLATFPDNQSFMVLNDDSGQQWSMTSGAASSGNKSVKLANFGVTNGSFDSFISGPIDLSTVDPTDNIIFTFSYAYKKRSSTNNEALKFYVSLDCGETWALRKNISNDNLGSLTQTSPYVPADASEWTNVEILNINSTYFVSNFRYKFEFENGGGNNIYVDDINIYSGSMVDLNNVDNSNSFSVYPNPVSDEMEINMELSNSADYSILLVNALGEIVDEVYTGYLNEGISSISYSTASLPTGLYFLRIESNGLIETKKIIKK